MRDDEQTFVTYCRDIADWGERIPTFIEEMTFEEFRNNQLVHPAVWKCVEVLGGASAKILKLPGDFASRYPALELRNAYAMRNQLSHGYATIDLEILWTTVREFVPPMVLEARAIVAARQR